MLTISWIVVAWNLVCGVANLTRRKYAMAAMGLVCAALLVTILIVTTINEQSSPASATPPVLPPPQRLEPAMGSVTWKVA